MSAGLRTVRVAAIDIGTVTTRLILAEQRDGVLREVARRGSVTDLGERVDATGLFVPAAIGRVTDTCRAFCEDIVVFGADAVLTVLTSAARDAGNASVLLDNLRGLGLDPQIISGDEEARIMFSGVAADFPGERIAVADSGGGSTEIAVGTGIPLVGAGDGTDGLPLGAKNAGESLAAADSAGAVGASSARAADARTGGARGAGMPSDARGVHAPGELRGLDRSQSLDIGCRRVTDRFLGAGGAGADAARRWMREQFSAFWDSVADKPTRLVAVGGTVTTLVAVRHRLVPYDSAFVHLHDLSLAEVEELARRFAGFTVDEIAALPGIEPKRAPVIYAGSLIIAELMRTGDYDGLTVSENGLLAGLARRALASTVR